MAIGIGTEELEAAFVKEFSCYLMALSIVSSDFKAGGETNAKRTTLTKLSKAFGSSLATAMGIALTRKTFEEFAQKAFDAMKRKENKKFFNVFPQDKDEALKIYVDVAVKIFRMFEWQFSNVLAEEDWTGKRAMAKLAEDAAGRVTNYVIDQYEEMKEEKEKYCNVKSSNFFFNAVLLGSSNNEYISKWTLTHKGKTVHCSTENGPAPAPTQEWNSTELFETSGYIVEDQGEIILYELTEGSKADIYGYRRKWPFDEFYPNKNWKVRHDSSFTEYPYSLPFTEEAVASRVQEIVDKIRKKETSRKGDVDEASKQTQSVMREESKCVVEKIEAGNKLLLEGHKEVISRLQQLECRATDDPKIPKWWPQKQPLVESLYKKRKFGARLLLDELHERITKKENKNRMVVICECVDASKYSAVGKTLTAKWYAHHYEEDYEHILWINCGSLLQSFKKLAMERKVEGWDKYTEIVDFTRRCYDIYDKFKCLWIYDNVESYEGIINALPKYRENFYCLITSRSRDWGTQNVGFGKIADLQLGFFSEEESLDFLRENLKCKIEPSEYQLQELCRLIGNLPLALQLVVEALNNGKIDLQNYIDKTCSEDVIQIVDTKYHDYEKTVYENVVKNSLDEMSKEKDGKLANEILNIFSYIQSDDVQAKFFMTIRNCKLKNLEQAIDLLQKYSLISKTGKSLENVFEGGCCGRGEIEREMDLLSIHQLLQQVIGHNWRNKEKKTLRKILGCNGFTEYKLIPFTKYADGELKKEFPKVKAELLDERTLKKLVDERNFKEAFQWAKFIDHELNTTRTKFNYCVCLDKNGLRDECVHIVEQMFENLSILNDKPSKSLETENEKIPMKNIYDYPKLLDWKKEPTEMDVGTFLLYSYLRLGRNEEALKIANQIVADVGQLIQILALTQIPNYHLIVTGKTIDLKLDGKTKKIELSGCSLSLSPFDRLSPEKLILRDVSFTQHGLDLEEVSVNEFLDLHKIKQLTLNCSLTKRNMCIDLNGDVAMDCLELWNVRVLDWKNANWNVQKLKLVETPFVESAKMKIKELEIHSSSLDISCLPQTIQKLTLLSTKLVMTGEIDLPNLKHLTLWKMDDSSCLTHFHSIPLTHVQLDYIREVNVDLFPQSVTHIKITKNTYYNTKIVGGVRKVDKLILEEFSLKEVEEYLCHFTTDNLIADYLIGIEAKQLLPLMKKEIQTIAVGRIKWEREENFEILTRLYLLSEFYLLEGGRGRAISNEEFQQFKKLL